MSLNLIPRLKGTGSRRAADKLAELRDDVRSLLTFKMAADDYFALLTQDRDDVYACWREEQALRQEAEEAAARMQSERDEWRDEALALRARFGPELAAEANAEAVTVPPAIRDTSAFEDQATEPIKVLTLQQAFGSTDPAHVPAWARRDKEVA
ncbi:hypothetical protein ACFY9G_22955 [Streptomyces anthocyanicus]|uniref:hypothetical protein n=1 Tax=Streptomyces anthocyanicus TaxID=68174 RepID=UPI0036EAC9DA